MKCRRIHFEKDAGGNVLERTIVWFGSYGRNENGTAKFFSDDKHDNYAKEKRGVSDALTQRLNVLQGELWYSVNEGMPIWDNHKNTVILDLYITSTVLEHPDVLRIANFDSRVEKSEQDNFSRYIANISIETKFGEISFNTSQQI